MIIWINGPFGVGKTQTANELNRRLIKSCIYDPENLGYFLKKNLPKEVSYHNDFQDIPFWRSGNYELLKYLDQTYPGIIIVPMTLYKKPYLKEILLTLKQEGLEVQHFSLLANIDTVKRRLNKRLDIDKRWPLSHYDGIIATLKDPSYGHIIYTDHLSIEDVAEKIAELCKIELEPRKRNPFSRVLYRVIVQIKHIRH